MRHMTMPFANLRRAAFSAAAVAAFALALWSGTVKASPVTAGAWNGLRGNVPLVAADWQGPLSLPPRFRNHCRYDLSRGGWYCANHCGPDYQFYYCSPASFGCCHAGYGYCDWKGRLRCAP